VGYVCDGCSDFGGRRGVTCSLQVCALSHYPAQLQGMYGVPVTTERALYLATADFPTNEQVPAVPATLFSSLKLWLCRSP
jgi:hypothetical protein